jgi:hypothetical protein
MDLSRLPSLVSVGFGSEELSLNVVRVNDSFGRGVRTARPPGFRWEPPVEQWRCQMGDPQRLAGCCPIGDPEQKEWSEHIDELHDEHNRNVLLTPQAHRIGLENNMSFLNATQCIGDGV